MKFVEHRNMQKKKMTKYAKIKLCIPDVFTIIQTCDLSSYFLD